MNIQIQQELMFGGTCGCEPIYHWETINVSPKELVDLIHRCNTIKNIQTMNNKYIVHTAIKCSDGKIRRLSYDLTDQTEGSVKEFGRVFKEIEKRFPDVQFWIQQYPNHDVTGLNDESFITIHEPVKQNTDNEV